MSTTVLPLSRIQPWRRGFTLIELLVAIAILGLLVIVAIPVAQSARESARRAVCLNHISDLAKAASSYETTHGKFPGGVFQQHFTTPPAFRGTSLFVELLPHLQHSDLARQWDRRDPITNTQGDQPRTALPLEILLCPSDVMPQNPVQDGLYRYALTSYGGNGGTRSYFPDKATVDGMFHTTGPASEPEENQKPTSSSQVKDGEQYTLFFGERSHDDTNYEILAGQNNGPRLDSWGWWAPSGGRRGIGHVTLSTMRPFNYRLSTNSTSQPQTPKQGSTTGGTSTQSPPQGFQDESDGRLTAYGSDHPGGANVAFVDGSARFLSSDIAPEIFRAMGTRAGNDSALPSSGP